MLTKYGFMENVDFVGCKVFNTLARQEVQEYILSIEMANHRNETTLTLHHCLRKSVVINFAPKI